MIGWTVIHRATPEPAEMARCTLRLCICQFQRPPSLLIRRNFTLPLSLLKLQILSNIMSERESSASSGAQQFRFVPESGQSDSSSSTARQFRFVSESGHSEARSHAMREHWKRRHRRRQEARFKLRPSCKTLLPRDRNLQESILNQDSSNQEDGMQEHYFSAQYFPGLNQILFSSRPDPFQTCPVRLTSQHQKLLYHCMHQSCVSTLIR